MNWNRWFGWIAARGVVFALMLLVLAWYYVRMLKGYSAPLVVPDEFGYSVIAAYLSGHDWSAIAQGLPWYNYGYGLVLAPVYALLEPTHWYHAAQFVNVTLLLVAGCAANVFLGDFVRDTVKRYLIVAAVLLYPTLVFNIHFTWAETLIVLLPWLVAIQASRLAGEHSGYLDATLYAVLLASCYYIHARLIALCVAGLVVLAYQVWRRGRWRRGLVCVAVFAVSMALGAWLKDYFIAHVYRGMVHGEQHSLVKEILEVLRRLQSPSAALTVLSSAAGQFAYLLIATMGMVVPGAIYMVWRMRQAHVEGRVGEVSGLLFLGLGLLGTYLLVALSMGASPGGPHHVFYGRYSDPIVLAAMAFGLAYCVEHPRKMPWMTLASLILAFVTVPLAMRLVATLSQKDTYWILIVGMFPYRTSGWQLNAHHLLLCFSLVMICLTLAFRWSPRVGVGVVCVALLLAGIDATRTFQAASSEHTFGWRARLDKPGERFKGTIIFETSDGDPLFLRTQAQMLNPEAHVRMVKGPLKADAGYAHEDHVHISRGSAGMQHQFCNFDETAKMPKPAVCSDMDSALFKPTISLALANPRKPLTYGHGLMDARLYYFVSTAPYFRTLWPSLGAHHVNLRYTAHGGFSTVAVMKTFVTQPGTTAWLGERSTKLFVKEGDSTGVVKVPVTMRGYDGNPLPPGEYSFHVVVAYPDGNDWSTILTAPMTIR